MTYPWLKELLELGLRPYVATSRHQLGALDIQAAGPEPLIFCLEDEDALGFHRAYVTANALAFGSRDIAMPNWVYVDCVLMQTAVVGFAAKREQAPTTLIKSFGPDNDGLEWLPVSGQIASPAIDGRTLVGFSLFSLRNLWAELPALGLVTKALALEVYRAREFDRFMGISQYDNPALALHGHFGKTIEIVSPRVPLHTDANMTLIYGMEIDFDPEQLGEPAEAAQDPDFWLDATDENAIDRLGEGTREGKRYFILPPFQVRDERTVKLPISERPKE